MTMIRLSLVLVFLIALIACSEEPSDEGAYHHARRGFRNVDSNPDTGLWGFLKWRWERMVKHVPDPASYSFPVAENDPHFLRSNRTQTTLTWIGHATVLLQVRGRNVLTDPHFSKRASPVQWAGPKRVVPPGLAPRDLPAIDAVVISHDHYDSLDAPSIRMLLRREGGKETVFFVPLGLAKWFRDAGAVRIVELDWWQSHREDDLRFTAVPVHHWSKRGLIGRNKTLWAGWVVEAPDFKFFFAGDSGYKPIFQEIGRRLGPFDLAAIPIGAYEPRWFMKYHHMSPEEAVKVHQDVKAKQSVAIHWGTFMLTDEPLDEPPKRLREALKDMGVPNDEFLALRHGETIFLDPDPGFQ